MVAALIALCRREGGHKVVALEAHISPDNLWQIINGTALPSGKPRGVGPNLRRRLALKYPDWLDAGDQPRQTAAAALPPAAQGDEGEIFVRWLNKIEDRDLRIRARDAAMQLVYAASEGMWTPAPPIQEQPPESQTKPAARPARAK